jgi:hypothetical protein
LFSVPPIENRYNNKKEKNMSELHTNLYFKHPDPETHEQLKNIVQSINDAPSPTFESAKDEMLHIAKIARGDEGVSIVNALLDLIDEEDLMAESRGTQSGYYTSHFVHGSAGDEVIGKIIKVLGELYPEIDARACLAGDDDPWEIFYRWEGGKVKQSYFEPDEEEMEDGERPQVYQWWHEGMPEDIKDGFLNEWDDYEEDEDY